MSALCDKCGCNYDSVDMCDDTTCVGCATKEQLEKRVVELNCLILDMETRLLQEGQG